MHGVTLENVVVKLVEHYGWDGLALRIRINCFKNNPSVKARCNHTKLPPPRNL
ncbi:VF530 family DNA-binding protein [Limnobacter sp.]|uniref:VF530 family DNA-binding protein n=1 Tax=Limnobacter sp. TaxID=2003368 RepID=UPI00391BCABD